VAIWHHLANQPLASSRGPRVLTSGARDLTAHLCPPITDARNAPLYKPRMPHIKHFFVYIMSNGPRSGSIYTGITGNLPRRVWQHKSKLCPGFTARYNLSRLVYYETFVYPDAAIAREKEIKGWRREKKIRLIEAMNPQWNDLAKDWPDLYKPESSRR
jgi:putative endonuclease